MNAPVRLFDVIEQPNEFPCICLGSNNTVMHRNCIVLGDSLSTDREYQLLIGSAAINQSFDLNPETFDMLHKALRACSQTNELTTTHDAKAEAFDLVNRESAPSAP